jgi:hypothetical protein
MNPLVTNVHSCSKFLERTRKLAFVALEETMDVLAKPNNCARPHVLVSATREKVLNSSNDIFRQAGPGVRLEERKFVQAVVIIVQDGVPSDFGMPPQPRPNFIASSGLGHVWTYVGKRNAVELGSKLSYWVHSPARRENDASPRAPDKLAKSR